jgi:methionine-S-sulfoxide reductase
MGSLSDVAILGCGNFWQAQDALHKLEGIVSSTVGYTGGTSSSPTYHSIGDHCEAVRLEFDPRVTSFEAILRHFFAVHDPTNDGSHHHRSVIFYIDELQKSIAEKFLGIVRQYHGDAVATTLEQATKFHPAEDYHQHYIARLTHGKEG